MVGTVFWRTYQRIVDIKHTTADVMVVRGTFPNTRYRTLKWTETTSDPLNNSSVKLTEKPFTAAATANMHPVILGGATVIGDSLPMRMWNRTENQVPFMFHVPKVRVSSLVVIH